VSVYVCVHSALLYAGLVRGSNGDLEFLEFTSYMVANMI
jgi:hypothetical protein